MKELLRRAVIAAWGAWYLIIGMTVTGGHGARAAEEAPALKPTAQIPQKSAREETQEAPDYSPLSAEKSVRTDRKLGLMLGLLADPLPTWLGVHVALNTWDFGRVRVSYGTTLGNVQAFGAGVDVLAPGWNLSPTLGFSYTSFSVASAAPGAVLGIDPGSSAARWCASVGIDYQGANGAEVGIGYQLSLTGTGGNPFLHAGWFFNWF